MSITLKLIGLFGVVLFGVLFSVTFVSPETAEKSAKGFVKYQIEKEVRKKQESISQSSVANKARNIADQLGFEADKIQADIENNLPEKIAAVMASMCGYDCEKKKAVTKSITSGYLERIKTIQVAQYTLGDIIKGKYLEIISKLKLDLRIFLGTNFIMFLFLLLVSFTKPQAVAHLFLPGVLLLLATVISSCIYVFGQNWFYTILYSNYMGFAYLAYIAVIFSVLLDIVINKARVTTEIINSIFSGIGSDFSVDLC